MRSARASGSNALGEQRVSTAGSDPYTHTIAADDQRRLLVHRSGGITDDAGRRSRSPLIGGKVNPTGSPTTRAKLNVSVDLVGQRVDVGSRTLTSCRTTNGSTSVR